MHVISVGFLPYLFGVAALSGLTSLILFLRGVFGHRRRILWTFIFSLILSVFVAYFSFWRYERIHSELFSHRVDSKTKEEVLLRYGAPSRKDFYADTEKRKIEVWFYDMTLLQPAVHAQFQFINDQICFVGWTNG